MHTTATPTEDGNAYLLNGVKLWTTNGVIADLLVVMANVPKSEGHRGGISAFVVDAHAPGVQVLHRNQFMGLRGIENGVTRFENVRVPAEDLIGEEGRGLKVALTTLNTGRLSVAGHLCRGRQVVCLKMKPWEWSSERVQWGQPVGKHEAVAKKLAFMAGTAFAVEAVSELSSLMADEDRRDIRIEAALAKLFCSEMTCRMADELVQIRGGRGFETAALAAGPGRAGGRGRASPAGLAHQPHLRGIVGDHEAADRPRGSRPASHRRRGDLIDKDADMREEGEGGGAGRGVLQPVAARAGRR